MATAERWEPDPNTRMPGTLCVCSRAGEVRTWGLAVIACPELLIRDCPEELIEEAKALLWDLAGWVVSSGKRPRAGDVFDLVEGLARLERCGPGLELWEQDPTTGAYGPGLRRILSLLAPRAGRSG